jgi:hypothetical protein
MFKKTCRPMRALVLAGVLSIATASAAYAGGVVGNAKTDQGHHKSGTQHRGGHKGGGHKGAAPNVIHPICSPYCTGGGSL